MRILLYCQHVLGMGHLFRSLELARAMHDHEVLLATGGPRVELDLPAHVRREQLPVLRMDADFSRLMTDGDDPRDLEAVMQARREQLLARVEEFRPNVFLAELYPFGRRAFDFELLPALALAGRLGSRRVCSLRDILVEKKDQARYERRVLERLNPHFDLLLVHSDPMVCSLERTFSRMAEIRPAVAYTGYVAPRFPKEAQNRAQALRTELGLGPGERLVVASAGSGSVGFELLQAGLDASKLLAPTLAHKCCVFTGPLMEEAQFQELSRVAADLPHVRLRRYSRRFEDFVAVADLCLSMGGYNTVMALVAAGVFGLVLPFAQNREQRMRAELLERRGLLQVLDADMLAPRRLAGLLQHALETPPLSRGGVDLRGARNTVRCLETLQAPARRRGAVGREVCQPWTGAPDEGAPWQVFLDQVDELLRRRQPGIFFRADDVAVPSPRLQRLLELFLLHEMPLHAAVVPAWLQDAHWRWLQQTTRGAPLFIWHQHGWRHANHETCGKKCEFGPGRALARKQRDLQKGRDRLARLMGPALAPWFTPPWNRMDADTLALLPELGFTGLSADAKLCAAAADLEPRLELLPVCLDLHTRSEPDAPAALEAMLQEAQAGARAGCLGIMLHHQRMNEASFRFLDLLLSRLPRGVAGS